MSPRGRRASLPPADHARPEILAANGLVVHHHNQEGRIRSYDFAALPAAEPLQRSLAALFAARCVPHRWAAHVTSEVYWRQISIFAGFLARQPRPLDDLDQLTAVLVRKWRASPEAGNATGKHQVARLLLGDARLQQGPVADELARRPARAKSTVQSYSEADFDQITLAARRMFRAALLRIEENARHLRQWRAGEFARDSREHTIGEALDFLARTGDLPFYLDKNGGRTFTNAHRHALGGSRALVTWQRLFLSRMEATALGVLLMAEFGWNLSVIDRLEVPRATPDQGEDGRLTYRIPLEKHRRGPGRHHETRNVTDDGAASSGRLITQALAATRFARVFVEDLAPGTDRLLVWRTKRVGQVREDQARLAPVGPFCFGIHSDAGKEWGKAAGFHGSPFRRGRRTTNALDRREPGQNSQDTHDRHYVLVDKRVQAAAVDVIAAGAEDAADRARARVLVAQVRDEPDPADLETATADCSDYTGSPYPSPDGGCGAPSFLWCLGCENARVHPGHHARLAHLHHALTNLRSVMPPGSWDADWGEPHARLDDLRRQLGDGIWERALTQVTSNDRELVHALLTGELTT
ncbi:hypothetical protein [Amycolatopsis sp. NPDC051128]|uniref:hypothetical protein n=1 Tax=Amycolatopsis sp. NPDC051128 TaxID=3155412 RepID=UPI003435D4B9